MQYSTAEPLPVCRQRSVAGPEVPNHRINFLEGVARPVPRGGARVHAAPRQQEGLAAKPKPKVLVVIVLANKQHNANY